MKFVVCYPWEKRRNYRWTEIIIALLAIIIGMNFGPSIVRAVKAGNMAVIIALSAIVVIFLFVGLISLWTNKFLITVNEKERTIEIKRFLRLTKRFNMLDVESWMVKINRKGRTLYLKFTGGSVKVKSFMNNWETLRKFLNDNASDRLVGDEGREATEYSFMNEADKHEAYVDGIWDDLWSVAHDLYEDGYSMEYLVCEKGSGSMLEAFKAAVNDQLLGEGHEDSKSAVNAMDFEISRSNKNIDTLFDSIPVNTDLSEDKVLKKKREFKDYLIKEFGQPVAVYTAEDLSEDNVKPLKDILDFDHFVEIDFIEFAEHTIGFVVSKDDI